MYFLINIYLIMRQCILCVVCMIQRYITDLYKYIENIENKSKSVQIIQYTEILP